MATRSTVKTKKRREARDMRPHATVKYVRISSRKVKIVIDLIRGKQVGEALAILQFTPKSASYVVEKLLKSAIANAEVLGHSKDSLYVAEVYANQGPTLKRMMARAKGSGAAILKISSHIGIVLDEIQ